MIILGIDPGLATLGYGVIETNGVKHKLVQYGTLNTPAHTEMAFRLRSLYEGMNQLLSIYRPDEVAFEELFFSKNVTTGINVSMARGVALLAVAQYTDKLYEYTPMQIKQTITGYGKADKKQIQQMVKMLLRMDELPKPDGAADAIACAITHCQAGRMREQFRMR